ncbi:hypothetical protein MnTg02_01650 [bacterium MnTg02]|nr:hypothetical protein MnTg02_01650 [bacterium MnTg02]
MRRRTRHELHETAGSCGARSLGVKFALLTHNSVNESGFNCFCDAPVQRRQEIYGISECFKRPTTRQPPFCEPHCQPHMSCLAGKPYQERQFALNLGVFRQMRVKYRNQHVQTGLFRGNNGVDRIAVQKLMDLVRGSRKD